MEVLKAFVILIAASGCMSQTFKSAPLSPMEMLHQVTLDQLGNYVMKWTPGKDVIVFEVHVPTTGFVGFGFSPNGGMKGADVIIGGVDDITGEVYFHDRYATGYTVPKIDRSQDVTLLGGHQNRTHTSLRFSRPWNTCDATEDFELTKDDTVRIIWSYGESDPADGDPMAIRYHGSNRGTKSLYLNEPRLQLPKEVLEGDVQAWELRSPNVTLPDDLTTLYWCKLFKIDPLPRKTHLIGFIPIISDDNIQHVHHILLYECHLPESHRYFEKWLDVDGAQCYGANMPASWRHCSNPIIAWAIGGEGSFFPDHVGFPLGEEHGGATYFLMEMHYDNPNLRRGIVDNSGLRLYHTDTLRPNDAGILGIGHSVSPTQIIPPRQEWISMAFCSSNCTDKHIPPEGIKVFAGILHSHLLGRNITVRHIRNKKELPVIQKDLNYDFNFQELRTLRKEVIVYPGDSFIIECGLDSTGRNIPTFGGIGTEEEMCLAFLSYYPRVELADCDSGPSMSNILGTLGIEIYPTKQSEGKSTHQHGIDESAESKLAEAIKNGIADIPLNKVDFSQIFSNIIIKTPAKHENLSFYDFVNSADTWKNEALVERYQDAVINGDHIQGCKVRKNNQDQKDKEVIITYPDFRPLQPPDNKCSVETDIGV